MPSGHERPFPDLPVRELLAGGRTLRASNILYKGTLINLFVPVSAKLISVAACGNQLTALGNLLIIRTEMGILSLDTG